MTLVAVNNKKAYRDLAVITGASSGIGEAFAKKLAAKRYNIILISNDKEGLSRVAKDITATSDVSVEILCADLSNEEKVDEIASKLKKKDVSLLINNAGIGIGSKFYLADEKLIHTAMSLHMLAPVKFMRAVVPNMLAANKGSIINVASAAAFSRNKKNCVVYNSTKIFLVTFSESLQKEIDACKKNVKVQALCPGFTRTNFHNITKVGERNFSKIPNFMWMEPDVVVDKSLSALKKRKVLYVPGTINKLTVFMFKNRLFAWIPNDIMEYEP